MNATAILHVPEAAALRDGDGRWRRLARATADGFTAADGESMSARVAGALAELFEGAAFVLDGIADDGAPVLRAQAGRRVSDVLARSALALAAAARAERRLLRDDAPGGEIVLAVPLCGRDGVIGAVAVSACELDGPDDATVLECFAAHAARALDAAPRDILESERRHAIGELAAGLAHHLNNLMMVALGNVELLLRHGLPEASASSLGAIERAVLDAAEVVRRLGASTGRPLVGTYTSLDLNSLVDDTLALSRACWHDEAQVRGVAIHARFERGPIPAVTGDEAEVRELLLNLVLNAVDALAAGGELIVRTWAEAGRVVCAVTDTGGGMTAAVRRRATEPFFTTRGPGRRGLGLSVVAGILERHRGRLAIDSRVGHGTTVSFQLPAGDPLPAEFREAASPAVHGLRVLVVDDETSVRATIAEILIEAGHEAVEAVDGAEALACLTAANGDFDVVLTDLGMPGLTGWDVIDRVKARWPGLAVILVTGWGEHPRGRDGRHEPDAVLAKPVTERRLRAALSNAVRAGI